MYIVISRIGRLGHAVLPDLAPLGSMLALGALVAPLAAAVPRVLAPLGCSTSAAAAAAAAGAAAAAAAVERHQLRRHEDVAVGERMAFFFVFF